MIKPQYSFKAVTFDRGALTRMTKFLSKLILITSLITLLVKPTAVWAVPEITTITPDNGPEAGGTGITIDGTGFEQTIEAAFVKNAGDDDVTITTMVADNNYIYVGGWYSTSLTIESEVITALGSDDGFVAKFEADGDLVWLRSGGSATDWDEVWAIGVDSGGNVYAAGSVGGVATFGSFSESVSGSSDIFLVKYSPEGTEQWLSLGGGTSSEATDDLVITEADEIFVTGDYRGTATFGPYSDTVEGGADSFVVKYDTDGNVEMLITGGGTLDDESYGVDVDSAGNIVIAGQTNSPSLTFGSHTANTAGSRDAFLAKFNSAGVAQWVRTGGGTGWDLAQAVAVDSNDNIFMAGAFGLTADFGTVEVVSLGSDEAYVAKYDQDGTAQWVQTGAGTNDGEFFAVEVGADDNIYVSGGFWEDITLDSETLTTPSGAVIARIDQDGNVVWAKMGASDDWAESYAVAVDDTGNVYAGGQFWPEITFDSITVTDPDANNFFLVKYAVTLPAVTIGGAVCNSLSLVSSTELSCSTPAGTAGAADVVVTNPDTSTDTLIGGFTYTSGAPDPSPTPTPSPSPTATPTPTPTPNPSPVTAGAAHVSEPSDAAALTTNLPTFSWTAPAEPQNVSSYQIFIDGVSFFGELPKESKETDDYILVYDSSNNSFRLQSKKTIADGTHTWYVQSKSTTGHTTDTATRTFTIGGGTSDATAITTTSTSDDFDDVEESEDEASTSAMLTTTNRDSSASATGGTNSLTGTSEDNGSVQGLFSQLNLPSFPVIAEATQTTLAPLEPIAPTAPLVVTVAAPIVVAAAVALQVGSSAFSPGIFAKIFQALGLFNYGLPQGLVYDSATHAPIPFALLTIASQDKKIQETSVTDVNGVYKGVKLPPGTYSIQVGHQEYAFPSRKQRPGYLTPQDFYVGAPFTVKSARAEQLFLIPMDNRGGGLKAVSLKTRLKHFAMWTLKNQTLIALGFFIFSGLMTVLSPTPINIALTTLYAGFLGYKMLKAFRRPLATGVVTDAKRKPITQAILKFVKPDVNQLVAVVTSNADGSYKAFIEPGTYQMMVVKPGYVWNEGGSPLSFTEMKFTQPKKVNVTLQSQQNVYDEMLKTSPQVTPSLA